MRPRLLDGFGHFGHVTQEKLLHSASWWGQPQFGLLPLAKDVHLEEVETRTADHYWMTQSVLTLSVHKILILPHLLQCAVSQGLGAASPPAAASPSPASRLPPCVDSGCQRNTPPLSGSTWVDALTQTETEMRQRQVTTLKNKGIQW